MKDKKEIISHHNNLTESYFNATELELNLFMTILFKAKFINENEMIINYDFIRKYFNAKDTSYKKFETTMRSLQRKEFVVKLREDLYRTIMPFPTLEFDRKKKEITVNINKDLLQLVTKLKDNFTKYSLLEFIQLKSKYSKRIYQLLMQYVSIKERKINIIELKKYLDCNTESYKEYRLFNQKILKKTITEINKKTNLVVKYEVIKSISKTTNRPVAHEILFKFYEKQKDILDVEEVSENLEEAVLKVKRNIYVSKAWNKRVDTKIKKLLDNEGEKYTIEILNELYKNLNKDIQTTLVQYINGIIKNKKLDLKEIKKTKVGSNIEISINETKSSKKVNESIKKEKEKIIFKELKIYKDLNDVDKEKIDDKAIKIFEEEFKGTKLNKKSLKIQFKATKNLYIIKALKEKKELVKKEPIKINRGKAEEKAVENLRNIMATKIRDRLKNEEIDFKTVVEFLEEKIETMVDVLDISIKYNIVIKS